MSDMNALLTAMKKASIEAVEASKPVQLIFGVVTSANPLQIQINQKLILGKAQLILCRNVTDYEVQMVVDHQTESHTHTHTIRDTYTGGGSATENTHSHSFKGQKSFLIKNALRIGEKVIMIRQQSGQKYLVIDRVVDE